jgi:murein hydrolase activator
MRAVFFFSFALFSIAASAAPKEPSQTQREDLDAVQKEIQNLESSINNAKLTEANLTSELLRLEKLLKLQALEIQLSSIEMEKMGERLQEMELRYQSLTETIQTRKKVLREYLSILPALEHRSPLVRLTESNLANVNQYRELVARIMKKDREEILALKNHLDDVEHLRRGLEAEREHILIHTEDLKEKQAILALNKSLKNQLLSKTRTEQIEKLRVYEAAKSAESELENMLNRIHHDSEAATANKIASLSPKGQSFASRKGSLVPPFLGDIITAFGKRYDPASSLYTFHKGIDIKTPPGAPVRAIFGGKIVFSGKLGGYGNLLIIDHGDQFYSLGGQLGETVKKAGDTVNEGEIIAKTSLDSTPLYFEIRQRHVAVNPLPWLKK